MSGLLGGVQQPAEQSGLRRRLRTLRVGAITVNGRRELCVIRNISEGGLSARVYSTPGVGQRAQVDLPSGVSRAGIVKWVSRPNIGIAFDEKADLADLLGAESGGRNGLPRRTPRINVDRLGELRIGARVIAINSCDISQGGVRI